MFIHVHVLYDTQEGVVRLEVNGSGRVLARSIRNLKKISMVLDRESNGPFMWALQPVKETHLLRFRLELERQRTLAAELTQWRGERPDPTRLFSSPLA